MLGPYSTCSNLMIYKLDDGSLSAASSRRFPLYVCCRFVGLFFVLFCFGVGCLGFFFPSVLISASLSVVQSSYWAIWAFCWRPSDFWFPTEHPVRLCCPRLSRSTQFSSLKWEFSSLTEIAGRRERLGAWYRFFSSDLETNASTKLWCPFLSSPYFWAVE